jgi:hypothetical protein
MRRLLAVMALSFPPLVAAFGCSTSLCDTAVTALCHRAQQCSTTGRSVFVSGSATDPVMGYSVVDYGSISSCEHQVGASCDLVETAGNQEAALQACEQVAFNAVCGEVPTAKGARLPDECVGVITLPPPP